MRKTLLTVTAICMLFIFYSCKKSNSTSSARTVQNLAGSYNLTALAWTTAGISVNVYDSLPDCEKDNILQLNADLTVNFIDGVPVCNPNESAQGVWSLTSNGDSLYIGSSHAYIKSWDGKTLVVTGIVDNGPPVVLGTSTFVKK